MAITIKATVMGDVLGDATVEQYERFADLCELAIIAAYPDADVTVSTALGTVGARPFDMQTRVDGSDDDDETASAVNVIMNTIYEYGQYSEA